MIGLQLQEDAP